MSDEQDLNVTKPDQVLSEEQIYRQTMSGVRSFLVGRIFLTLIVPQLGLMTTPSPDLKLLHQERFLYKCLQKSGSVKNLVN